jgi:Ca2+-binding RTX toxin-like protein
MSARAISAAACTALALTLASASPALAHGNARGNHLSQIEDPCHSPGAIRGTNNNDILTGTAGDDIICGFGGDDTIHGLGGNDIIIGGPGNDIIYANDKANLDDKAIDTIDGGTGNDTCFSTAGDKVTNCP